MTSTTATTTKAKRLASIVPKIPTSTQWICFSTSLRQTANIEWTENNFQQRNALYYVNKCYWGELLPVGQLVEQQDVNLVVDDRDLPNKGQTSDKAGDASKQFGRKDSVHIEAGNTGQPSIGTGATQGIASGAGSQQPTGHGATQGLANNAGKQGTGKEAAQGMADNASGQQSTGKGAMQGTAGKAAEQPSTGKGAIQGTATNIAQQVSGTRVIRLRKTPVVRLTTKRKIKIEGETRIFIAAEYIEPDSQGGPMEKHHIRDLAGLTGDEDKEKNVWVYLQLNECVHYGQNGSGQNLKRWLVYHPPISTSFQAPRIFQHRFTGLTSAELAFAGVELATKNTPPEYEPVAEVVGKLAGIGINAMKSAIGHYLHPFLDQQQVQEAEELLKKVDLPNRSQYRTDALRIIEAKTIGVENMRDDALTVDRIQRETQHRIALKAMVEKKSGWFMQFFTWNKKSNKISTDKTLAAGLNACYDGDANLQAWAKEKAQEDFEVSYKEIDEGAKTRTIFQTEHNAPTLVAQDAEPDGDPDVSFLFDGEQDGGATYIPNSVVNPGNQNILQNPRGFGGRLNPRMDQSPPQINAALLNNVGQRPSKLSSNIKIKTKPGGAM